MKRSAVVIGKILDLLVKSGAWICDVVLYSFFGCILAWVEHLLHEASSADQGRPGIAVDVQGVLEVGPQQLVKRVHDTQVADGGDNERLHAGMSAQPVIHPSLRLETAVVFQRNNKS